MSRKPQLSPRERERIKDRIRDLHEDGVITRSEAEALELHELHVGLRASAAILRLAPTTVKDRLTRARRKILRHNERSQGGA